MAHFLHNTRLRWALGSVLLGILDLIVFISCLQAENVRCASITGIIGLIALCLAAWHGLIYIAARRGGFY